MIDFGKLQADVIKDIFKSKFTGEVADYKVCGPIIIDGNRYIPVVYKNISTFLIPVAYCLLSLTIIDVGIDAKKTFKNIKGVEELQDTKMIKQTSDGRRLKELKTPAGKTIFVDESLLKPFGQGIRYYVNKDCNIAVYIKEAEKYLGLAMATRYRGRR
jgi:hypothetical protein